MRIEYSTIQSLLVENGKEAERVRSSTGRLLKNTYVYSEHDVMEVVAQEIGVDTIDECSIRQYCLNFLAQHDIHDRWSLLTKTPSWFKSEDVQFPFASGIKFARMILGKPIKQVTTQTLEKIADKLGWDKLDETGMQEHYLAILAQHGITDRQSLFAKGTKWFTKRAKFPPIGGGHMFVGRILGRRIIEISVEVLQEVADKLSLPEMSDESRSQYLAILAQHGITDRQSLFAKGVTWFTKHAKFPPIGGGHAFICRVIGQQAKFVTDAMFKEFADKMGWEEPQEKVRLKQYLETLAQHGITDRQSLLAKRVNWYKSQEATFPPFGGATAFFSTILGKQFRNVSSNVLQEVADKLGWQ